MLSPIVSPALVANLHAKVIQVVLPHRNLPPLPSLLSPSYTHMAYAAFHCLTATLLIRSVGQSSCGDKSRCHSIQFDLST